MTLVYLNGEIIDEQRCADPRERPRLRVCRWHLRGDPRVRGQAVQNGAAHRAAGAQRGFDQAGVGPVSWEIGKIAEDLLIREAADEASIYIQVTRGSAPRSHAIPKSAKNTTFVAIRPPLAPARSC